MKKIDLALTTVQYSPIFKGVSTLVIDQLLRGNCQLLSFTKDEYVASAGDECKGLYILTEGSVVGEMIDDLGKTIQIEEVKTPKPIAVGFIYGQSKFPVYVSAMGNTTILVIKQEYLNKMFKENEKILTNFLNLLSHRSQFLTKRISFLTSNSIKKKLAKYIVDIVSEKKMEFTFPNSQERMAEFFGVTRPAFARVLKTFKDKELINSKGRNVTVLDIDGLNNIINEV